MTGNIEEEHGDLLASARGLISELRGFGGRLRPSKVSHFQHMEFSQRAGSLANYLDGVVVLTRGNLYQPALATLRASLEHHALDLLLFLGNRYEQVYRRVDNKRWEEWQRAREAKEDWTTDILEWFRDGSEVRIIRSGLHLTGGGRGARARSLSIYYHILDGFDPLAGHPKHQEHLSSGFSDPEVYVDLAQRNQATYHAALSWSAIKRNLKINKLYNMRALAQLEVHYTFLSVFVHPSTAGYRMLYGHSYPSRVGEYDHYNSEMCLLYVVALALAELEALGKMARRTPRVVLHEWSSIEAQLVTARRLVAHLWFPPSGKPTEFDRIEDANRRFSLSYRKKRPVVPDPKMIADRSIRYYRDPLRRLVRLHQSSTELMTGLSYRSPWERPDAVRR